MKDAQIIHMIKETCTLLASMEWHQDGTILTASYNGILEAAQVNHPDEPFLEALSPFSMEEKTGPRELQILFTQIRITLEALQSETMNFK